MKGLQEGNEVLVLWDDGECRPGTITGIDKYTIESIFNEDKQVGEIGFIDELGSDSFKHIPITPESVECLGIEIESVNSEGFSFWVEGGRHQSNFYYTPEYLRTDWETEYINVKSIAQLQNLIELLTGEMPKFNRDKYVELMKNKAK